MKASELIALRQNEIAKHFNAITKAHLLRLGVRFCRDCGNVENMNMTTSEWKRYCETVSVPEPTEAT